MLTEGTPSSGFRNTLIWPAITLLALIGGCAKSTKPYGDGPGINPPSKAELAAVPDAIPKKEPPSAYGNPQSYEVFGKNYYPMKTATGYREQGIASWYGRKFHGRRTSSGEPYDMYAMTAAHRTLPLPSYVRVTNLVNQSNIIVKVNDRGPFHANRLIDLSYVAAWKLGITQEGTGLVEIEVVNPEVAIQPQPVITKPASAPGKLPQLFVQVGAFSQHKNAVRLKHNLANQLSTPVQVHQSGAAPGTGYKVQVGPIGSVALCDLLTQRLNELGIQDTHIVIR